jgi:hypothetical protein
MERNHLRLNGTTTVEDRGDFPRPNTDTIVITITMDMDLENG